MKKSSQSVLTRESIVDAIAKGAKSFTKIAHLHGYHGSVSGNVVAKIKALVPEVADLMTGKPVVAQTEQVVEQVEHIEQVTEQKKVPYRRGMYGVFFPAVVGKELKRKDYPTIVQGILTNETAKTQVDKMRSKVGDADLVAKLTHALTSALGVFATPKHQSNMDRSKNASEVRGVKKIVTL